VRPHGQLVDDEHPVGPLEQLDGQQAGDAQLGGDPQRHLLRPRGHARIQAGCRREHLNALAILLHGLHHRPCRRLAERGARDESGQLPAHRHGLLDEQGRAGRQQFGDELWIRVAQQPDAAPVVPATRRLEHHRPPVLGSEPRDVARLADLGERRPGQA
jgi:hypothetical protein